jgi:zinc and cadmium transporter
MDYLLLLSSIVVGVLTVLLFRLEERGFIKLLNAFIGAYLLCLTFLHLLPELYAHAEGETPSRFLIGLLILAGFFVQLILDTISMGIEHGHTHALHGRAAIGVLTGLCLHAFVEAMALGEARTHYDPGSRQLLLWSIVVHNYPVSIALFVMLLHSGMKRGKALGLLALFAAMAPLGMTLSGHTALAHHTRELTALVIGIFMHIGTTILFETTDGHLFNRQKTLAIILGLIFGALTLWWH